MASKKNDNCCPDNRNIPDHPRRPVKSCSCTEVHKPAKFRIPRRKTRVPCFNANKYNRCECACVRDLTPEPEPRQLRTYDPPTPKQPKPPTKAEIKRNEFILMLGQKNIFDLLQFMYDTWKSEKPYGFAAKPAKIRGKVSFLHWKCSIPGKDATTWEGGRYYFTMEFSDDYPIVPPTIRFKPVIFHVNVDIYGQLNTPLLNELKEWKPALTIRQILLHIQKVLSKPCIDEASNRFAENAYIDNRLGYETRIRSQAMYLADRVDYEELAKDDISEDDVDSETNEEDQSMSQVEDYSSNKT